MREYPFVPLQFQRRPVDESLLRARELIELAIRAAGTAPRGDHQQPWTFVAISDAERKRRIREPAEAEEYENYYGRMPADWLNALAPLGTDEHKPPLTDAPWVLVLFRQSYGLDAAANRKTDYYTQLDEIAVRR